jgi:recombination protein RecT
MTEHTEIQKISSYMQSETIKARFAEVVGNRNAAAYIASVILAVANDDTGNLKQCQPSSIYVSALRAATLRLSVDPSTGQAYLVPFKDKATLIVGYKGLQDMAVRTGNYRYINTSPIYDGEGVEIDRITGAAKLIGGRTGRNIVGWLASFEMLNGFSKVLYMTIDEIHAHAKKFSRGYESKSARNVWVTNTDEMERKTVLRLLLRKWGYLDPVDVATLEQVELEAETPIDAEVVEQALEQDQKKSESELLNELGYKTEEPAVTEQAALPGVQ